MMDDGEDELIVSQLLREEIQKLSAKNSELNRLRLELDDLNKRQRNDVENRVSEIINLREVNNKNKNQINLQIFCVFIYAKAKYFC